MIHPLLQQHADAIRNLSTRFRVRRLDLFGSAARGQDRPTSDLDFIVELEPLPPVEYGRCYFGLLFGLEDLLHRRIDLVTAPSIENLFFLKEIEPDRTVVYDTAGV